MAQHTADPRATHIVLGAQLIRVIRDEARAAVQEFTDQLRTRLMGEGDATRRHRKHRAKARAANKPRRMLGRVRRSP